VISDGEIRTVTRIGHIMPLTYGAHGKVIAFLNGQEREITLKDEDLYSYGNPGRLDRARLAIELAECRRNGFASEFSVKRPKGSTPWRRQSLVLAQHT
jgi:DNA-binding IclR family transcriptional regulator